MNSFEQNNIIINNRSEIEIKGIKDIITYDSEKIIFDMGESQLILNGDNFNIKRIDVDNKCSLVTGYINSLTFSDIGGKAAKSFLSSLFK